MSALSLTTLRREARRRGVTLPSPATLDKYGLDERAWLAHLDDQDWVCPICGQFPKAGKFVTDHEHVRGWKAMLPEERAKYVRGLTCWFDNRYLLARAVSVAKAESIVEYLKRYALRRPR